MNIYIYTGEFGLGEKKWAKVRRVRIGHVLLLVDTFAFWVCVKAHVLKALAHYFATFFISFLFLFQQ